MSDDLIQEFLLESRENLEQVDRDLVALEQDPQDRQRLNRVFRCIHTIKGTCGFLELSRLEALAHAGENLLGPLRDGHLPLTAERIDGLLSLVDGVRAILDRVEATGQEGDGDDRDLRGRMDRLLQERAPEPAGPAPVVAGDLADEFVAECREHLEALRQDLPALPEAGRLGNAYRAFHNIRAACLLFAFPRVEALAGAGERLLAEVQEGSTGWSGSFLQVLEGLADALDGRVSSIAATGREGEGDDAAVLQTIPTEPPAPAPVAPAPTPPVQDEEMLHEFLAESRDLLEQADRDLVRMEQASTDPALLPRVFRSFHTIKGSAGLLGFPILERITHAGESLLAGLRDGHLLVTEERTAGLLSLVDAIRSVLASIETVAHEGSNRFDDLVTLLEALQQERPSAAPAPQPAVMPAEEAAEATSLRVDVGLLDRLMTQVGELVLARNQILQRTAGTDDPALLKSSQYLHRVTTEVQEGIMKTRMQPIDHVWKKYPRLARDVAKSCGKQVLLEMEGRATELDRSLLEAIHDPMVHLVRNSIDHGIETPEVRQSRGKPPQGRVRLKAWHEGGQVLIEISDDGAGIDAERVREKAIQRGLLPPGSTEQLGPREILALLTLPGFSTAEQVTHLSGRGVGMDVVRTHVEKIGGTLDLATQPGRGTVFRIRIPLTLAILPALLVSSGGERFAIPQVNLVEVIRLDRERAGSAIEMVHGVAVYRLRDLLLPLVYLDRELQLSSIPARAPYILVLHADRQPFGLVVDGISDVHDIVVKPLGRLLAGLSVFAGSTILGDGSVVLILDVPGLAQRAHAVSPEKPAEVAPPAVEGEAEAPRAFLVLEGPNGERYALEVSQVVRLERFSRSRIEPSGAQYVVQYQDRIIPLVALEGLFGQGRQPLPEHVSAAVCDFQGKWLAVTAQRIVDIVYDVPRVRGAATRPGVVCRTVVGERVVELLEVGRLLAAAFPVVKA